MDGGIYVCSSNPDDCRGNHFMAGCAHMQYSIDNYSSPIDLRLSAGHDPFMIGFVQLEIIFDSGVEFEWIDKNSWHLWLS